MLSRNLPAEYWRMRDGRHPELGEVSARRSLLDKRRLTTHHVLIQ